MGKKITTLFLLIYHMNFKFSFNNECRQQSNFYVFQQTSLAVFCAFKYNFLRQSLPASPGYQSGPLHSKANNLCFKQNALGIYKNYKIVLALLLDQSV
jgi:hypothetical protein